MESIFSWKYFKSKLTLKNIIETLQIIEFKFFSTARVLFQNPGKLIHSYLSGEKKYQNPVSFYLSSLLFFYLASYIFESLAPETAVDSEPSESEIIQYLITIPFIVVIAFCNYILFRVCKLNIISHTIIAIYILGQSIFYLTFYYLAHSFFQLSFSNILNALIYIFIVFVNIVVINFSTFKVTLFQAILKSLLIILIGFFSVGFLSSIFL